MRILNLHFKNINSLEGESRVDFAHGPIAESGVFAITGPNGSGKSSILDVITLALYGETYRFHKPAEHVITKHASESLASVEFQIGGNRYTSRWEVNREISEFPIMQLTHLVDEDWVTIADTPSQVRKSLAEISGMDFHRFSKSMVLPQGDFAAFLNALDSERMDILEKISGNDFYVGYEKQVEDLIPALQSRIDQLEQDISLIPLLDSTAMETARLDLEDFKEQAEDHKQVLIEVNDQSQAQELKLKRNVLRLLIT
jgi:exonuclease SbcC